MVSSAMIFILLYYTSHHDACRNLYGRSAARLPTGHSSWPACQGTSPTLVLRARVHEWSLPAGWPAQTAYIGTDCVYFRYRCMNAPAGAFCPSLSGLFDPNRDRHAKMGHAVQYV